MQRNGVILKHFANICKQFPNASERFLNGFQHFQVPLDNIANALKCIGNALKCIPMFHLFFHGFGGNLQIASMTKYASVSTRKLENDCVQREWLGNAHKVTEWFKIHKLSPTRFEGHQPSGRSRLWVQHQRGRKFSILVLIQERMSPRTPYQCWAQLANLEQLCDFVEAT